MKEKILHFDKINKIKKYKINISYIFILMFITILSIPNKLKASEYPKGVTDDMKAGYNSLYNLCQTAKNLIPNCYNLSCYQEDIRSFLDNHKKVIECLKARNMNDSDLISLVINQCKDYKERGCPYVKDINCNLSMDLIQNDKEYLNSITTKINQCKDIEVSNSTILKNLQNTCQQYKESGCEYLQDLNCNDSNLLVRDNLLIHYRIEKCKCFNLKKECTSLNCSSITDNGIPQDIQNNMKLCEENPSSFNDTNTNLAEYKDDLEECKKLQNTCSTLLCLFNNKTFAEQTKKDMKSCKKNQASFQQEIYEGDFKLSRTERQVVYSELLNDSDTSLVYLIKNYLKSNGYIKQNQTINLQQKFVEGSTYIYEYSDNGKTVGVTYDSHTAAIRVIK